MIRTIFLYCAVISTLLVNYPATGFKLFEGLLFSNKCIEDLGCFYTGRPFFDPIYRPVSVAPAGILNTKFHLYTPSNVDERYDLEITEESLLKSPFNAKLKTMIFIHGYKSDLGEDDIRHPKRKAMLKQGQYNVIIVDWTKDNQSPYVQAVANTRSTGAKVAKLINFLMERTGITAQSVHIIGHSLGAHLSGYVGERVKNLGRITGLDPAGPDFMNMDPSVRLDPTDALFVDVIHTDARYYMSGLGYPDSLGHMDFFPNGGITQPGCVMASGGRSFMGAAINSTAGMLSNVCDHSRANELFLESIDNSKCRFLAVQCSSYEDFQKGLCTPENSKVAEMGFYAEMIPNLKRPAKFYLTTRGTSPFCIENIIAT